MMVEKLPEDMDLSPSASEAGPVEDVVQALLDYLVDPMLPLKSSGREVPSLAQQQSVAKQVHAVVLLYNYYQRKLHPEIEFIGFESFCKLVVVLKPTLIGYVKLMHRSDYAELDDLEDQLSVTDKAIMNACDIASVLDASKDAPIIEGWAVSKVAVLLTDSSKENCSLQFSSITHGVWSLIEKDLDTSTVSFERTPNGKHISKRKRINKKPSRVEGNADEAGLRQLALSAVKEETGIKESDLAILESHVVYSLSKEKTTTHFFIVQCTQSVDKDLQVPIKYVIESLHGPLVRKSSGNWTVTPVVEYFHLLPYAGILTNWFSRISNSLRQLRLGLENSDVKTLQRTDNLDKVDVDRGDPSRNAHKEVSEDRDASDKEVIKDIDDNNKCCDKEVAEHGDDSGNKSDKEVIEHCNDSNKNSDKEVIKVRDKCNKNSDIADSLCSEANETNIESEKQIDDKGSGTICLSNSNTGQQNMDIDDPTMVCRRNENTSVSNRNIIKVYHHRKGMTSHADSKVNAKTSGIKVDLDATMTKSCVAESKDKKVDTGKKSCSIVSANQDELPIGDHAVVPFQLNPKYLEKLQVSLASKNNALSQTALRVLLRKRVKLSLQLRDLGDEIAVCDKNIQTILDGSEDDLALKIEAIIDGWSDVCLKSETETHEGTCQHFEDLGSPLYSRRKKSSETVLASRSSCQELDDLCCENNWKLPTYHVSPADGGFQANVVVKGVEFEFSEESDLHPSPRSARESAAAQMTARLRSMEPQSQV